MSNSGARSPTRLGRWLGRLPLPSLGQSIQWWPYIWPYVVASVSAAFALAVFWMEAIPFEGRVAFVAFGTFATTAWVLLLLRTQWTAIIRFMRRRGFSIKVEGLGLSVAASKNMVGQRRDLVVWSDVQCRIVGASVIGFNYSTRPIARVEVYACSLKTNEIIAGLLDGMDPQTTFGIPGRCEFRAMVRFSDSTPGREGLSREDFCDFIGSFDLVVACDGKEKAVRFPWWWNDGVIENAIAQMDSKQPPTKPRVTKRPSAASRT